MLSGFSIFATFTIVFFTTKGGVDLKVPHTRLTPLTTSRCAALLLYGLLGLPNRSAPPEIILDPFPLGNLSLPSLYLSCLPPPRPPDPPRPPHPPREVNLQHPFLCLPH